MLYDVNYLTLLSKQYPNVDAVSSEIINLSAIANLPKGTEHFLADIHGEYEAFDHVMRNASGVIRRKIDETFCDEMTETEKDELATLVYYPHEKIILQKRAMKTLSKDEQLKWYKKTLIELIRLCRQSAVKYSSSKVRKSIPIHYQHTIEELLSADETNKMKYPYYRGIIDTIIEVNHSDDFIIVLAELIQKLVVDHLHIIGDIYDRGYGAHLVMETLRAHHSVDIQWGNHDVLWIGAACGSEVCMADVLRISLRYATLETLQEGYGLNLSLLVRLTINQYQDNYSSTFKVKDDEVYRKEKDLKLLSQMQKAIAVIMFKLEGQLIMRRPEFGLEHRMLLHRMDVKSGTLKIGGTIYKMNDRNFPTVDPDQPYALTEDEQAVVEELRSSFLHSSILQKHVRFLIDKGSMYKVYNGNLLYHGCVPMTEGGGFQAFEILGKSLKGKALMDAFDEVVRKAYYSQDSEEKELGKDLMWYLWCGPVSPLFGKEKMATFERYFLSDKETYQEPKNSYYKWREDEQKCRCILAEFGLRDETSYIINGHVPVKAVKGEQPIKANGKLIIIDGGFAKAYQKETGIAGYTLIFNSQGMNLVSHEPFESKDKAIKDDIDILPISVFFEKSGSRMLVGDTDIGAKLKNEIHALKSLLKAYREGVIKEA